jgi:hypothetical protein
VRARRGRTARRMVSLVLTLLPAAAAGAQDTTFNLDGHVKYRLLGATYPDEGLLRELAWYF